MSPNIFGKLWPDFQDAKDPLFLMRRPVTAKVGGLAEDMSNTPLHRAKFAEELQVPATSGSTPYMVASTRWLHVVTGGGGGGGEEASLPLMCDLDCVVICVLCRELVLPSCTLHLQGSWSGWRRCHWTRRHAAAR
jgi:hypothetical protein